MVQYLHARTNVNPNLKQMGILLLIGFTWGSAFALARYAVSAGFTPLSYAFFNVLGSSIILLIYGFRKKCFSKITKKHIFYFFITSLLGIVIPDINKYNIALHLASGTLSIITNTVPLFIYPLAILAKEEAFNFKRFIGVLIGMIGIFFIVTPMGSIAHFQLNIWPLLALITPFSYALCSIYIVKYRPDNSDSMMLCAGMMFMALILLSPILLNIRIFHAIKFTFNFLNFAIICEIILSTIAYILLFELLKNVGSVFYSLTDGLVVITSLLWGYLFFNEKIHLSIVFAIIFIFIGIGLVAFQWTGNKGQDRENRLLI